jgi:hypothetical protein
MEQLSQYSLILTVNFRSAGTVMEIPSLKRVRPLRVMVMTPVTS